MTLLIPTNDGISIASDFARAYSFRCMTVVNGHVNEDDLRRIETNAIEGFLKTLEKQEYKMGKSGYTSGLTPDKKNELENIGTVLVSGISNEFEKIFHNHHFDVIHTSERIIFNAVMDYLRDYAASESNYCCMP
jgi:predicted Fe-Mo cluster-binding NifX family protein